MLTLIWTLLAFKTYGKKYRGTVNEKWTKTMLLSKNDSMIQIFELDTDATCNSATLCRAFLRYSSQRGKVLGENVHVQ